MIRKILYKVFRLTPDSCASCEILRDQLEKSEVERKDLLHKLLDREKPEQSVQAPEKEEFKPIQSQFIPWRVRQQMLEAEDHKQAVLIKQSKDDIAKLEKELGIAVGDK